MIIILSVSIVAIGIVLSCCVETFRKYALPLFVLFTLVFALLVGVTICGYKSTVVLLAAGLTLLVVIALTAYACTSIII